MRVIAGKEIPLDIYDVIDEFRAGSDAERERIMRAVQDAYRKLRTNSSVQLRAVNLIRAAVGSPPPSGQEWHNPRGLLLDRPIPDTMFLLLLDALPAMQVKDAAQSAGRLLELTFTPNAIAWQDPDAVGDVRERLWRHYARTSLESFLIFPWQGVEQPWVVRAVAFVQETIDRYFSDEKRNLGTARRRLQDMERWFKEHTKYQGFHHTVPDELRAWLDVRYVSLGVQNEEHEQRQEQERRDKQREVNRRLVDEFRREFPSTQIALSAVSAERALQVQWALQALQGAGAVADGDEHVQRAVQRLIDGHARRRQREEHAAEERRAHEQRNHARIERWRTRIEDRCSRIVTVFNGVFGLQIDPHAVLEGAVSGEYASISSSASHVGMQLVLRQEQRLLQCMVAKTGTWLSIEEGEDEEEAKATYASANFLIWHELAHLANPSVVAEVLGERFTGDGAATAQARELVVDAVGLGLGRMLYVHPGFDAPRAYIVDPQERLRVMAGSHRTLVRRIVSRHAGTSPDLKTVCLLARLRAAQDVHRTLQSGGSRLAALAGVDELLIGHEETLARYRALYERALLLDVSTLSFRGSFGDDEDHEEHAFRGRTG
ncbi:MAG: hypothetical protein Q8R16_03220 [bacterium]|nr:hypothetical protein [bacterium]